MHIFSFIYIFVPFETLVHVAHIYMNGLLVFSRYYCFKSTKNYFIIAVKTVERICLFFGYLIEFALWWMDVYFVGYANLFCGG